MDTNVQPPQGPKLMFMVEWLNSVYCVSVGVDATLWDFKEKIMVVTSVRANDQQLVHGGTRLSGNDRPVRSFGITGRITLHKKIQVTVKHAGGAPVSIAVHSGMTVRQLKRKAIDTLGLVFNENYILKRRGHGDHLALDDNSTLAAANVNNGCALELVLINN
ncbi:uncharacterized protein LOC112490582 isoform X1 [Ziziphus jujuba]|uniref:Uncharacterized protein LOC112490582 isoform X1 n=1 Tax=Ziziphus jujuba TaxID=326968 RepID=A0A6P6FWM6_ZIZJJ|nr:uncharacterized protein LOC112490582 isoform X1 [Ziziphus jujuba]